MIRTIVRPILSTLAIVIAMVIGILMDDSNNQPTNQAPAPIVIIEDNDSPDANPAQQETIPPSTPLATLTPSATLKPPPTLEPPTNTPTPSLTPTVTPSPTVDTNVSLIGLNGLETATPTTTPGCVKREDWQLTYTVQRDDALVNIATKYGTYADDLAKGNCLKDKNMIVVGQVLRVPGETQPYQPSVECVPYEGLTPANRSTENPADGMYTFNWRGPVSPKNLLRIVRPDGSIYEESIEFAQNKQINASEQLAQAGTYSWYLIPLDYDGSVIGCPSGGPWIFTKPASGS